MNKRAKKRKLRRPVSIEKTNGHLTTAQLAKRWDIDPVTLRNWRMRNMGPPYFRPSGKGLGHVRYKVEDIEKWEESR